MPCQKDGTPGKNFAIGSESAIFPSSTCSIRAAEVNILPSEPDWKMVSAVTGTRRNYYGPAYIIPPVFGSSGRDFQ